MAVRVVEFEREDGASPFGRWFNDLPAPAAAKVATAIYRMESGHTSAIKWFSGIGEYRIDWGPGYRIYLAKDGEKLIVLFGGGTKTRQGADIDRALKLLDEYKLRKAALRRGGG